jgi:hypothetical protein
MRSGLQIDYETADRIALCVMKDQLAYLLKEQEWFETPEDQRDKLIDKFNLHHALYVHPEDYALNRDKHIPALKHIIEYFGGTV